VKVWRNVDAGTGGITRIDVSREGSSLAFHAFGACKPTECDWGVVSVPYRNVPITVGYRFSFKTTTLTVVLDADTLLVSSLDHYTDTSGRQDRVTKYEFK
jgi:hypothetical protein